MYPILYLHSAVVKLRPVGALPLSSGSCLLVGWVVVCRAFEALVSTSCPWVDLALDALLRLVLLVLGEATEVLAGVVVAQGCPIGRSILLLCPLAVLAPAV
jgi:hypothetical protein